MKRLRKPLLSSQLDLQLSNINKLLLSAESEWAQYFWEYTKQRLIKKYRSIFPKVCKKYENDITIH